MNTKEVQTLNLSSVSNQNQHNCDGSTHNTQNYPQKQSRCSIRDNMLSRQNILSGENILSVDKNYQFSNRSSAINLRSPYENQINNCRSAVFNPYIQNRLKQQAEAMPGNIYYSDQQIQSLQITNFFQNDIRKFTSKIEDLGPQLIQEEACNLQKENSSDTPEKPDTCSFKSNSIIDSWDTEMPQIVSELETEFQQVQVITDEKQKSTTKQQSILGRSASRTNKKNNSFSQILSLSITKKKQNVSQKSVDEAKISYIELEQIINNPSIEKTIQELIEQQSTSGQKSDATNQQAKSDVRSQKLIIDNQFKKLSIYEQVIDRQKRSVKKSFKQSQNKSSQYSFQSAIGSQQTSKLKYQTPLASIKSSKQSVYRPSSVNSDFLKGILSPTETVKVNDQLLSKYCNQQKNDIERMEFENIKNCVQQFLIQQDRQTSLRKVSSNQRAEELASRILHLKKDFGWIKSALNEHVDILQHSQQKKTTSDIIVAGFQEFQNQS